MKFFSNHLPPKMSNQSELSTDVCKAASTPTYSLRLSANNRSEASDATDCKGLRPTFGGFSLTAKSKLERSGHIVGFPLSSERRDRTDARADRSSDSRVHRLEPKSKVHPIDGFFRYDDRISTFATWPKSHPIPAQICESWPLLFWRRR